MKVGLKAVTHREHREKRARHSFGACEEVCAWLLIVF